MAGKLLNQVTEQTNLDLLMNAASWPVNWSNTGKSRRIPYCRAHLVRRSVPPIAADPGLNGQGQRC